MNCINCGKELNDSAVFCPFCGSRIEDETQMQAAGTEAAAAAQAAPVHADAEPLHEITVPVQKKKSKAGLIAGVTAAAVVVGGAGVGYFGFRDSIMHAFMGDAGYAGKIDRSAYSAELLSDGKTNSAAVSGAVTYLVSRSTDDKSADRIGGASEAISMLAKLPDIAASVIPEGTSLTNEYAVQAEQGSLIPSDENGVYQFVCEMMNGINTRTKLVNGTDADSFSFGFYDNGGDLGSAMLYSGNGDLLASFPGISDRTVLIPKEKLDEIGKSDGKPRKSVPVDEAEAQRILKEAINIYYASYEDAEIEYNDIAERLASVKDISVSVKGSTYVTVKLNKSQLRGMLNKIIAFLRDDEYLIGYAKDDLGLSEDEYKKRMSDLDDKFNAELLISHIADKDGNALTTGITLSVEDTNSYFEIKSASEGGNTVINTALGIGKEKYDGTKYTEKLTADIGIARESDTDGRAVALFSRIDDISADTGTGFGIECSYTGFGKADWLGYKMPVGKFIIKPSDPDALTDMLKQSYLLRSETDEAAKFLNELKKLEVTIESSASGNTADASLMVSAGDIGSITFDCTSSTAEENVQMPDKTAAIDLSKGADATNDMGMLGQDMLDWAIGVLGRSDFAKENIIPLLDGSYINRYDDNDYDELQGETSQNADDEYPDELITLNKYAKELSDHMAAQLYQHGYVQGEGSSPVSVDGTPEVMLLFTSDADGNTKAQVTYVDGEQRDLDIFDAAVIKDLEEIFELEVATAITRPKLIFAYHFFGGDYVGITVLKSGTGVFSFPTDPNLPTAGDFLNGFFGGWCDLDGGYDRYVPGCFINKEGKLAYAGTYCVSTDSELRHRDAGDFINSDTIEFEGTWEAKNVVGDIIEKSDDFLGITGLDANSDGIDGGTLTAEISFDKAVFTFTDEDGYKHTSSYFIRYYYGEDIGGIKAYLYKTYDDMDAQNTAGMIYGRSTDLYICDYETGMTYRFESATPQTSAGAWYFTPSENVSLSDITGEWYIKYRDTYDMYFTVFNDYTINIRTSGQDEMYMLEQQGGSFRVYDVDGTDLNGTIEYDRQTDRIRLVSYDPEDYIILERATSENTGFGAVDFNADLKDIAGTWVGDFDGHKITLDFNEDGECWGDGDRSSLIYFNPRGGVFDLYSDTSASQRIGVVEYSAETDSIRVTDFDNDESIVMKRSSSANGGSGSVYFHGDISDIVGKWEGKFYDDDSSFDIKENYEVIIDGDSSSVVYIDPRGGVYDIYRDRNASEKVGVIEYIAGTDSISITDLVNNYTAVFTRAKNR